MTLSSPFDDNGSRRGLRLPARAKIKAAKLACIPLKALLGARSYLVPDPIRTIMMCGRGGTGRRATLRSLWPKGRGSSSLLDRTIIAVCGVSSVAWPEAGRESPGTPYMGGCAQNDAAVPRRKPRLRMIASSVSV